MGRILCFGEVLMRFSPTMESQWLKAASLPVFLGGAELNVASALAKWGLPVSSCSVLPDSYITQDILKVLNEKGINTNNIILSGDRIGCYWLKQGTDLKNQSVIYDRTHSSFSELKTGMINWDHVFHDVTWFHFSAISPALNDSVAAVCQEALEIASLKNIKISIDLNYRPKLWKLRNPHGLMSKLISRCDVVMGNIWSAHELLGIPLDSHLIERKEKTSYIQHAHQTATKILKRFARVKTVANTFRFEEEAGGISYFGSLYSAHRWADSSIYRSDKVLDKVGTGDCFMAGLIYGLYNNLPELEVIQLATAAGFGKFFELGDATNQELKSIWERIKKHE
jgi:2-dehydro-3-deoxygluconokinase